FFFQAGDGIRDRNVTGVQTCALPIYAHVVSHVVTVSSRLPGRVVEFDLITGDQLTKDAKVAQLYAKPEKLKLKQIEAQIASTQEIGRASCRERGQRPGEGQTAIKKVK